MAVEVSKEVLTGLAAVVEKLALDRSFVLGGLLDAEGKLSDRADFEAILPVYERLEASLPSGQMERLGSVVFDLPALHNPTRALGLFMDPSRLLTSSVDHIERFFSNVESGWERQSELRYRVELRIPGGGPPAESFLRFQAGVIAGLPRIIGLPEARVAVDVEPHRAVYWVELPPSRTVWARIRAVVSVVRNGQSAALELTAKSHDLRAKNAALTLALAEAREALQTQESFLATISHELRTPVNGLVGSLDMVEPYAGPELRPYLEPVRSSTERLRTKVEALVDFTEVVAGRLHIGPEPTPVATLTERLRRRAKRSPLNPPRPQIRIAAGLPFALVVDAERVEQLLAILLDNVAAHADAKTCEIDLDWREGQLQLAVTDDGVGIPPEARRRIIKAFSQGLRRRANLGLGLGLSLGSQLCQRLGGSLVVDAGPGGRGTTVRITVAAPAAGRVKESGPKAKLRRALVVDDDATNRLVASRLLELFGAEVTEAENGALALEVATTESFDLILMDCDMPVMDVFEATKRLREVLPSSLPIVAFTAYSSVQDRERCKAAGMEGMLGKPMTRERLADYLAARFEVVLEEID